MSNCAAVRDLFPVFPFGERLKGGAAYNFINADEEAEKILARYPNINRSIKARFVGKGGWVPESVADLEKFERDFLKLPLCHLGGLMWATVESKDDDIKKVCEKLADISRIKLVDEAKRYREKGATKWQAANYLKLSMRTISLSVGIECLLGKDEELAKLTEVELFELLTSSAARMCDEKWWRRKIRTQQARMLDHVCRVLGLVNKKNGIYSATATYWRHLHRKNKNKALLESLVAENQYGYKKTLAELAAVGMSNPVMRGNELVTRVRGFEEWAKQDGGNWQAMFYTLTAPSRFHSHDARGNPYVLWSESGSPNPRMAQAWLCDVWEKVRAEMDRAGIRVFGLRVAEPHHDSCPHWHIALWVPTGRVSEFNNIFFHYSIGADGDLPPTRAMVERRLKIEKVRDSNPVTGEPESMVSYILKYITKNVNGVKNNGEEFEAGAISKALRVEAWASTWGIRQFQQIGGAPVTVWRELRRISESEADNVEKIWDAADSGDWCEFTKQMGGAVVRREDLPIRPLYAAKKEEGEIKSNAYGECIKVIKGLIAFGWLEIKTRLYEWRVYVASPKGALAWTCVNNCTEPDF